MKNYSIFAYKPDSSDYCRGCHMADYSSDSFVGINLTRSQMVAEAARLMSYNTQSGERGYDIVLMAATAAGTVSFGDTVDIDHNDFGLDDEGESLYDVTRDDLAAAMVEAEDESKRLQQEAKQLEAERKRQHEQLVQQQIAERELAQLAELRAKYNQ